MNYNILNSFCQTFHLVSSSPFPLFYDNSPFLLMIGLIIILILMINIFVKNSEFNILNNPILLSNKNPKDKSRNSSIPNKKSKNIQEISEIVKGLNKQDPLKVHLRKGYLGYTNEFKLINIILDDRQSFIAAIQPFLQSLDSNKIYHVLPVLKAQMVEESKNFVITQHAIKVHKDMDIISLANNLMLHCNFTMMQYHVTSFLELSFLFREWYDLKELRANKTKNDVLNVLNKNAEFKDKDLNSNNADVSILRFQATKLGAIFFDPNSVTSLFLTESDYSFTLSTYRAEVHKLSSTKYSSKFTVKLFNLDGSDLGQFIFHYFPEKRLIIRKLDSFEAKFIIEGHDKFKEVNINYKFPTMKTKPKEKTRNDKFGTIDFETYSDALGNFIVYAAAYAYMENDIIINKCFYKPKVSTQDVIMAMINDLCRHKFNGFTFYAHNLGRFDGIFLLHKLLENKLKFSTIMKDDNTIINITLRKDHIKIIFKDSLQLFRGSLAKLTRDFQVDFQKDIFPHKFATLDNLYYRGPVPAINFFENITQQEYNDYCLRFPDKWDFKEELVKYCIKDVIALLQILIKLNNEIFNSYGLNITSYNTIAALALAIYLSNFYKEKYNLKVIKGQIEEEIRSAYYGGITAVHGNSMENGFYYDVNSSYPASMLKPMPVGNPKYTTNNNLDELFGFVKAVVVAPSADVLANAVLPVRTKDGLILFRDTRIGMWFSEELKAAKAVGYIVDVIHSYTFKKGINIFSGFINTLYAMKSANDLNPSKRQTAKLLLVSLYGRLGMRDIDFKVEVVDSDQAMHIFQEYDWTSILEVNGRAVVRYGKKLDPSLLDLFNENGIINKGNGKVYGTISSIAAAAATSAYSRMLLNKFTNIPGNLAIYTDTDSVVLNKALPDRMVGKALGDMKLEHVVRKGIFIAPKTYALITQEGKLIAKAKGVNIPLTWQNYVDLLAGNTITFQQSYWKRDIIKGTVNILEQGYTLRGIKTLSLVVYRYNMAIVRYRGK